ncbi:concanavalin A-like lectin/glucanase superfamily protein [Motilibacter peucedani]|uniref:Concanavalin A-like lectin/glucanase superfamily protein n=1 Tax=Motilibacter peucedani TaxID=598650 RepID=A0A420XT61_9ACTN|nr:LamG-like jellyroll fold domain-containing protein [Motilibacter peucedani]RKS77929.1 concanavalin A-like lectin/glucanase superfamily protein [Motilibacter peucedani]
MRAARSLATLAVAALLAAGAAALPAGPAAALENGTVPAAAASSWQTNGVVRAITVANGIVYLGGDFTSVRPPGAAAGSGEVSRRYLAAFSASTGALVSSINHTVSAPVYGLSTSSDGSRVYLSGDFTSIDGASHGRVAALSAAGGGLLPWAPSVNGRVNSVVATATTAYVGGSFSQAGGGAATRVAALSASTGARVAGFSASADNVVYSMALSAAGDVLYLAGGFLSVNGNTGYHAAAPVSAATGALLPFSAGSVIPPKSATCTSEMKTVKTDAGAVYFGAEGTGGGCFDGTFSARVSDGTLRWVSRCLGATQGIEILNGLLYEGSHAHDCSADKSDPDAFPEVGWSRGLSRHLLARSASDGHVSSWYPNTNGGPGGAGLGPRVLATDGTQLFVGGEFTSVNGRNQQGFVRFSPSTGDTTSPAQPAAPSVTARPGGALAVYVQSPLDTDDTDLTVRIYRDGGSTPIASVPVHALFWRDPVVGVEDAGLAVGSSHTYTADAVETFGTRVSPRSAASPAVQAVATLPAYSTAVLDDSPRLFWRLGDVRAPAAADSSPNLTGGVFSPTGVSYGVAGKGPGELAITTDGVSGLLSSSAAVPAPTAFSIEAWFRTTTTSGGKILGFGNRQGGLDFNGNAAVSGSYDKHVYMTNNGRLVFGVYTGSPQTITSASSYNDGQWHHVVGTQGAAGMALYVDDVRVGTNPTTTNQSFSGYWRVGGDNLASWPNVPTSAFFAGTIDDPAVYPTALTAAQVDAHWRASGRGPADTTPPKTAITSPAPGASVQGLTTVSATASDDTAVASVTLRVDGSVVGTDTSAPYEFAWAASGAGSHTLVTTAQDAAGNTGSSSPVVVTVTSTGDTTPPGPPGATTVTGRGTDHVDLAWTAASDDQGVAGYRLVRDGTVLPTVITGLSTTDTGLAPGSRHTWTVRAVDTSGNVGPDSAAVSARTLLFTDSWAGADGTPWSSAWTTGTSNGTVSTQAGGGSLLVGNVSGAFARAQLTGAAPRADTDTVLSYRWSSTGATGYLDVYVRGSGGWQNAYRPLTGYGIEVASNSTTVSLSRNVNGVRTTLSTVNAQSVTTARQWLRIRVTGSTVQYRIWPDGSPEPAAWSSTVTDTAVTAPGQLFVSADRGSQSTTSRSVTLDDLVVADLAP